MPKSPEGSPIETEGRPGWPWAKIDQTSQEISPEIRAKMLGNPELSFNERFANYPEPIRKILWDHFAFLTSVDSIHYTAAYPYIKDIFQSGEYEQLIQEEKTHILQDIIAQAHNDLVRFEAGTTSLQKSAIEARFAITKPADPANYEKQVYPDFRLFGEGLPEHGWEMESFQMTIDRSIKELSKAGDPDPIDFILDFWDKNGDPAYGHTIAATISKLNSQHGVSRILERLPQAEQIDQRRLLSLLYRLELGQVGISEEGLDYLGRRFDLGEYNDPQNFAQRITADGKVGVFDAEKSLTGFVQLEAEDFRPEAERSIRKAVSDITYEMLFTQQEGETPEEKQTREQILANFKAQYFETYLNLFASEENQSGIRFNNLTLPEQAFVLEFLNQNKDNSELNHRFFTFLGRYGEDGFRSFRALEFYPEAGKKILELGLGLKPELGQIIFNRYSEIAQIAENVSKNLAEVLKHQVESHSALQEQIKANLLERGAQLIMSVAETDNPQEILKKMSSWQKEMIFFASTFKTLKEAGEPIELEDFQKFGIEIADPSEINPSDKKEMITIATENWSAYPHLQNTVVDGLSQALDSANKRFYILRYDQDIIGFIRFDPQENGTLYAGSLNIQPNLRGSKIGEAVLQKVLTQEAQDHVIFATAYPKLPIAPRYIGEFGFVASGIIDNYESTGESFFQMVRDNRANQAYEYLNQSTQNIAQDFEKAPQEGKGPIIRRYNLRDEYDTFISDARTILGQGYVMTAYRRAKDELQTTYVGFERKT